MMIKVTKDGKAGFVDYNHETKELTVEFPDNKIKKEIVKYLTTERMFLIPESETIDDYREDNVKPTKELYYMEMALCTMYTTIDVFPVFETLTGGTAEVYG